MDLDTEETRETHNIYTIPLILDGTFFKIIRIINASFQRESAVLVCRRFKGRHSYDKIAEMIHDILYEYNLEAKKVVKVTNNASNMVKAFLIFDRNRHFGEENFYGELLSILLQTQKSLQKLQHRHLKYCAKLVMLLEIWIDSWIASKDDQFFRRGIRTLPVHLTASTSSFPTNLIILVFSLFNSKPFLSIYPSNLFNILLILPSSSANNTTSSAYAKLCTFPSPNFTPPHLTLPISSSRSVRGDPD
ncbi:hypothetical protein ALC57_11199 [Trachymyrmex cornetzi]|uniref:Uncharacterized protein n=1 Tax=Trachymyrmex cornetzi TaxID=471704 RepID=A0A151J2V2_9HYME|nr:hypothetical protein ALC57_11199 [Trachymyrmex cornetzi]